MLEKRLYEYLEDVENPELNYKLAIEYKNIGQTAAAISFFLRCADRSGDNLDLAYECLLHIGICFDLQKNRGEHAKQSYKHAISICPRRPEAYYLLCNYCNWYNQQSDAYFLSKLALNICNFDLPKLQSDVKYRGKWNLIYEKTISSWWWGKLKEHEEGLLILRDEYLDDLDDYHKDKVLNFCIEHKVPSKTLDLIIKSEYKKHDIILQGPIDGITKSVVDDYLNLPFVNKIIVSTWKDQEFDYSDNRVEIIKNEYPLVSGTCNKNLQITTTLSGLRKCVLEYAVKMRTDQKYHNDSMMLMYDFFINNDHEDKLYTNAVYPNLLFHPRDHTFWGKTKNLIKMFDIPLEYNSLSDKIRLGKYEMANYVDHFTRPETYLGAHYLSKYDDRIKTMLIYPEKNLYDNCENWIKNYQISNELMPKYFGIFPFNGIDVEWPRRIKGTKFNPKVHMPGEKYYEDNPYKNV